MNAAIDDDVDVVLAIKWLWRAKWVIADVGLVCGLVAVVVTLMIQDVYRSEATLAPASDPTEFSAGSLAAQVSNLAGLSLGGSAADPTQVTLATLQSKSFLVSFARKHGLEVPLIAGERWDVDEQEWMINQDLYDVEGKRWVRKPDPPRGAEPSDGEIYEKLSECLDVNFDRTTGLVKVSFDSISPLAARDWLRMMLADVDVEMRKRAIHEATASVGYLEQQISSTPIATMQESLGRLMEDQLRNRMLAEVRESFALKIIDPPDLPEEKIWPLRAVICIAATLLGGLLAALAVLVRNAIRHK